MKRFNLRTPGILALAAFCVLAMSGVFAYLEGPVIELDHQASDPAAPSGSDIRIYAKSGELYMRDAGGIEQVSGALSNPMTAADDIIVGASGGTPTRVDTNLIGDIEASITTATVTFDYTGGAAEDIVNWTSHGLSNWDRVFFTNSGGALPAEISADTLYYVINKATDYFQITATLGGTVLEFTDDGSGTSTAYVGGAKLKTDVTVKFAAHLGAGNQTVGTTVETVVFDVEEEDSHGAFDTGTGIFTAPITGTYFISYGIRVDSDSATEVNSYIYVNSTYIRGPAKFSSLASNEYVTLSGAHVFDLTVGDTVLIRSGSTGSTYTAEGHATSSLTFISGHQIGGVQ